MIKDLKVSKALKVVKVNVDQKAPRVSADRPAKTAKLVQLVRLDQRAKEETTELMVKMVYQEILDQRVKMVRMEQRDQVVQRAKPANPVRWDQKVKTERPVPKENPVWTVSMACPVKMA